MIEVPSTMTFPAHEAVIELEPVMGGAYDAIYGPGVRALSGLGDDTTDGIDWTQVITAGEQAAASIINATNAPACPTGQTRNASGVCTVPAAAVATVNTASGAGASVGLSGTAIAMIALAGLVVLVLVMKK